MRKINIFYKLATSVLLVSMVFTACSAPADTKISSEVSSEASVIEGAVRLQDDFYNGVNAEWLTNTAIPGDMPMVQPMTQIQQEVNDQIRSDMDAMLRNRPENLSSEINEFLNFYEMMSDKEGREKEGFTSILPYLQKLDKIENLKDFNEALPELILDGFSVPFSFMITGDMSNSQVNMLYLDSPGTILPSAYYSTEIADGLLAEYESMLTKYFTAMDYSEEEALKIAADTIMFDAVLVPLMRTGQESSVLTGYYNPVPFADFCEQADVIDFPEIIREISGQDIDELSVINTRYFDNLSTVITEENLPMIKSWMRTQFALVYANYLPRVFQEITFEYNKLLSGVDVIVSEEEQIYAAASGPFGQPIGLYFGETYFGEESKKEVGGMVDKFILEYKEKIRAADWLSDETKDMAILKLDTLYVSVGYPDKIEAYYSEFKIKGYADGGSIIDNMETYTNYVWKTTFEKIGQPTDRELWMMTADTVNANAIAMQNAIYIPAAILQAPFYSKDQTASENYGGIGTVIAHEISHVFDSNGAMYDEKGNINNWWTEEDFAAFGQKIEAVTKQFDGLSYGGGTIDGALSVSENMADNAAMSCALAVLDDLEDKNYKEFFTAWTKCWAMKATPEYEALARDTDVHAPNIYRVNTLLPNFPEFYEAFDVNEDDEMYLNEEERIIIW